MTKKLIKATSIPRPSDGEVPKLGQWYWVKEKDGRKTRTWLGCVMHVGSNYVEIEKAASEYRTTLRIHADEFFEICTPAGTSMSYINGQIAHHQTNVQLLMDDIKALTARLGITRGELGDGTQSTSQALSVVSKENDAKAYGRELVKAKTETLPDLFKKLEEEHKWAARWMKSTMLPMRARAESLKSSIEGIEDRIFTVELYAGLIEEMVKIADGKPAPNDTKISLFQRRHYMDEECLLRYEAGGMSFEDINAFDQWLLKPDNRNRLLPKERCIVAFRVRRLRKDRGIPHSIEAFIQMWHEEKRDEKTHLYIRNGEQVYRLSTGIEFDEELFPDRDHSLLLSKGGELWADTSWREVKEIISDAEYKARRKESRRKKRAHDKEVRAYNALSEEEQKKASWPSSFWDEFKESRWTKVNPDTVFYDDVMKKIAKDARAHNRVAVVLQGILDRSPALHPHPPWQLWTAEGFTAALDLVYDQSRALTDGEPPDFEAFRNKLNASLKKGCVTVGQQDTWEQEQAKKENHRRACDWRLRSEDRYYRQTHYVPYGNPGPGLIARVANFGKRGCTYQWERERLRPGPWVDHPEKDGYLVRDNSPITTRFTCSVKKVLNVSAYKAGDFLQFFNDPRTRAEYLKWAPMLLAAEDYVNKG